MCYIWGCIGFDSNPEVTIASSGWLLRPLKKAELNIKADRKELAFAA